MNKSVISPYKIEFSQNFLKTDAAKKAVDLMRFATGEQVIEIGPGKGALTQHLLEKADKLTVVEQDEYLARQLKTQYAAIFKLAVINADFLEYRLPVRESYTIVGNIPYALTADILRKLLNNSNPPAQAYLIMQKEAASRLAGIDQAGALETNFFALQFWPWFQIEVLYQFSHQDFNPVPNVKSVLIKIAKREQPIVAGQHRNLYLDFIAFCFTQTSGKLEQSLKKLFTQNQLGTIVKKYGINLKVSPTQLTFHDWAVLFDSFVNHVPNAQQKLIFRSFDRLSAQQEKLEKQHRTRSR